MARAPRPTELGEILTRLREELSLGQPEVGRRLGLTQSAVAQAEVGRTLPDAQRLALYLSLYNPDERTRGRLEQLIDVGEQRRVVLHRGGAPRAQRRYRDLTRRAVRVTTVTTSVVPGLLQTDAYAAAIAGSEAPSEAARELWLEERARRREMLDETGREFVQITAAASALLWAFASQQVMLEQLAHLAEVSRKPTVQLGVVPLLRPVGFLMPGDFDVYELPDGTRQVVSGSTGGVAFYSDREDVAVHLRMVEQVAAAAVWGDEARAELERIAGEYRRR